MSHTDKPKRSQAQTWDPKVEGEPSPEARRRARRLVLQASKPGADGGERAADTADTSRQTA